MEKLTVKYYCLHDRAIIKGFGFEGLSIGDERDDVERFIEFFNSTLEKCLHLEESLEYARKCGRALPDYQEEDIIKIRKKFPVESSGYADTTIASAYSLYCEENHGAGWTETDLDKFGVWAFNGAINLCG